METAAFPAFLPQELAAALVERRLPAPGGADGTAASGWLRWQGLAQLVELRWVRLADGSYRYALLVSDSGADRERRELADARLAAWLVGYRLRHPVVAAAPDRRRRR
jgi:hypothetical protein